jgi:hypothetical protein
MTLKASARPTVYVLRPGTTRPALLTSCESVDGAVVLARSVRVIFGAQAWVAGWARFAHAPTPVEADIEAVYARAEAACG